MAIGQLRLKEGEEEEETKQKEKDDIWLMPMSKAPIQTKNTIKQSDNTY